MGRQLALRESRGLERLAANRFVSTSPPVVFQSTQHSVGGERAQRVPQELALSMEEEEEEEEGC